jgi:hypothetical protein
MWGCRIESEEVNNVDKGDGSQYGSSPDVTYSVGNYFPSSRPKNSHPGKSDVHPTNIHPNYSCSTHHGCLAMLVIPDDVHSHQFILTLCMGHTSMGVAYDGIH